MRAAECECGAFGQNKSAKSMLIRRTATEIATKGRARANWGHAPPRVTGTDTVTERVRMDRLRGYGSGYGLAAVGWTSFSKTQIPNGGTKWNCTAVCCGA